MSEDDNFIQEKPFSVEIAKQGRAVCKKCRQKCVQGDLRIAKLIPNPCGSGKMKTWHHVSCIFEMFLKQRQTTKRIEGSHDVEGWELLSNDDKADILKKIKECNKAFEVKLQNKLSKKSKSSNNKGKPQLSFISLNEDSVSVSSDTNIKDGSHKDNCFREFRMIVANVSNVNGSNEKISIFHDIFAKGSDGTGFKGDVMLWCKLLLPAVIKRVFHLQTKQLIKLFSKIFHVTEESIMEHLDQSDVGQTIQYFFEQSKKCKPQKKSTLTIYEVDDFLETLTNLPKEDDQLQHFKAFMKKCTANDLKVVIRLIKHDLRMNAGAKHVFEGLHPDAYQIFKTCRDIKTVINTCWEGPPKKEKTEIGLNEKRKSIPNYFDNIKLYLEDGVPERHAEWVRYFIAYGGTVLKPSEHEQATHVLHLKDTISEPTIKCVSSARHVIVEWIKDTVAKESLQDYRPYTVRWKPSYKG
ncbi:DNA ligase A N and/or zf-PARP domain containing protein [Asbolus verrucosus]|uniref:DNA ligase A N and/or zf-PARP domain containing protein n=1 Tax=Asbolus verrucosus TaxID=1661398 RepID=A0A482VYD7_ASBVE|nr:DNA ligase A N and/or zf-PARP domain containing protein [Asbolus verrucosus]